MQKKGPLLLLLASRPDLRPLSEQEIRREGPPLFFFSLFLLLLLLLAVLRNVRERKGKLNGAFIFRVGEYRGGGKGRFKWSFVCVCFEFRNVSPPEKSQRHVLKLANPCYFPYIFFFS